MIQLLYDNKRWFSYMIYDIFLVRHLCNHVRGCDPLVKLGRKLPNYVLFYCQ